MQYSPTTIQRASRAWRCSPFTLTLLQQMYLESVGLTAIAGPSGLQNRYTRTPLLELTAESNLMWLIQVGLLRREVDGQGITDRFRLTPLGRQIADRWQQRPAALRSPNLGEQVQNLLSRWLKRV